MAYTRKNILKRILRVQEIYLSNKDRGLSNKYIFENYIKDQYAVSIGTFYKYLSINARKELKEINQSSEKCKIEPEYY